MKIIDWFWKVLTLIIIGLLMLNPEFIIMSSFIDAIGLEMFSLLIEVQIISVVGFYFHNWIKPVLMPFYNYFKKFFNSVIGQSQVETDLIKCRKKPKSAAQS